MAMNNVISNIECLSCGSSNIKLLLDLGDQPLANNYLMNEDEAEDRYLLAVNLCHDCFHLQLSHTVDPEIIYKNYLYVSGTSKTIKEYSDWFAGYVTESIVRKTYNILDIGCNDGTQLDYFKRRGYDTFGIDPAENIYPTSSAKHKIICDFFGPNVISKVKNRFDAITAQNVFAHSPNPLEFLETCKELMADHTMLFIQTSQADMVLNNEFDTIYHEHVNFFTINSMNKLANRAGLFLIDAIRTPIHGNSYLFVLGKPSSIFPIAVNQRPYNIENGIKMEHRLQDLNTYIQWESNIRTNMSELKSTILNYQYLGYKVIGYGAAAKGNTLLNFIDVKLDLVIDDNPLKQNLYLPGTRVLIKGADAIAEFSSDDNIVFMPLAWNFFSEISQRIKSLRNNPNDVFLKYFPEVEIKNV